MRAGSKGAASEPGAGLEEAGPRADPREPALAAAAVLALAVFAAGLALPPEVVPAGLYIVPVLVSVWRGSRRATLFTAAACTTLAAVGLLVQMRLHGGEELGAGIFNTAVAVFALLATARLGLWRIDVERDLARSREAIRELAYRDELTGLPNRTSLLDRMELELAHARRDGKRLGVLFLDLDGFKAVNDSFGHRVGDLLLRHVATRLEKTLRDGDTVARLGGDEFTVLLPGLADSAVARGVAQKITSALSHPLVLEDNVLRVGVSVGIAVFPDDGASAEELLERADQAMYRVKQERGSRRRKERGGRKRTAGADSPPDRPRPTAQGSR